MPAATMRTFRFSRTAAGPRARAVAVRAANVEQLKSAKVECEDLVKKANCAPIMVRLGMFRAFRVGDDTSDDGARV
jgi:hypothetical protein